MRQSKSKEIRRVLSLPRLPQEMTTEDKWFYRAVKRVYSSTPRPARTAYLDSAVRIRQAIKDRMKNVKKS
jgi:hypothetical protein